MAVIKDIEGIWRHIDSWNPWKTVGILSLTHGNEPAWLQAQKERINQWYADLVVSGQIYLIQVNLKAHKQNKRFVDVNMNRIVWQEGFVDTYEYGRLQKLLPYIDGMDLVLDIHSTTQEKHNLMGICHTKDVDIAEEVLGTERILVDDNFDHQWSVISLVTRRGGVGFGIECGSHHSPDTYHNALANIHRFLAHARCYGTEVEYTNATSKTVFRFYEEIFPMSKNFMYAKNYSNFDSIAPWEIYAYDGDTTYSNTTSKELFIGLMGNEVIVGDGICFLFTKV